MMNLRNIFNPSYIYIGIIVIIIIVILMFINNKSIVKVGYDVSRSMLIAAMTTLIVGLILNYVMDSLIVSKYKILVQVISDNLIHSVYMYSIASLLISILTLIGLKCFFKQEI